MLLLNSLLSGIGIGVGTPFRGKPPGGGAAFAPSDISGLVGEFYATVGVTDDGGGEVSNWADQSGNGNDYLATFSARPTFSTSPDKITFNGTSNRLKTATFTLNQPFTRVLLITQVSWTSGDFICDGFNTASAYMYQNNLSPEIRITAGGAELENAGITIGVEGVLVGIWDNAGANSSIIVDDGTPVTGATGATGAAGLSLGNDAASNNGGNIVVRAELVYNKALSASEITSVTTYMQSL